MLTATNVYFAKGWTRTNVPPLSGAMASQALKGPIDCPSFAGPLLHFVEERELIARNRLCSGRGARPWGSQFPAAFYAKPGDFPNKTMGNDVVIGVVIGVSLVLSFLFSGMEAGVLALNARLRIKRQLMRSGDRRAQVLHEFLRRSRRIFCGRS